MFRGILVYDKADAEYNKWFIDHMIETGLERGLYIELKLTEELLTDGKVTVSEKPDFVIMRNRNAKMNEVFEQSGVKCFNSSYVCRIGNDKWEMYRDFCNAGIPVMYTQCSKLPFPFVMKPKDGHGGKDVNLVENADAYNALCQTVKTDDFIYQMLASEKGRDIRVYVVGDCILTAMERKSEGFLANYSLGGSASEHSLTDDELKLAAKVANHIKADFAGIDIIYNNGKPVINEIEDAVGTRMLYANTDIDAVKEYINWIVKCIEEE